MVACVEDFTATCANDKDAYIGSMFESYKYRVRNICSSMTFTFLTPVSVKPTWKQYAEVPEDQKILQSYSEQEIQTERL